MPRRFAVLSLSALSSLAFVSSAHAAAFFSEYVEGSSNNKALEIANTGPGSLDLSQCEVLRYSNGSTQGVSIALSGTLAAGQVHVICNNRFDSSNLNLCDQTDSNINFNGDDAVELRCNGTTRDVIGQIGTDPGSAWTGNGVSTQNATLCRKSNVSSGDTNGSDAFDPSVQWVGLPINTFGGLGNLNGCAAEPEPTPLSCSESVVTIGTVQGTGPSSPFVDQVRTVRGVVTAVMGNGFFLQNNDTQGDGNSATSDGIWIYNPKELSVTKGQIHTVSGKVGEFFGKTQITAAAVSNPCGAGSVSVTRVSVTSLSNWERFEGMMVRPRANVVVTNNYNLERYNEIGVSAGGVLRQPTEESRPGADALARAATNANRYFIIEDTSSTQNVYPLLCPNGGLNTANGDTCRAGSEILASSVEGPLDYAYGTYRIRDLNASVSIKSGTGKRPTELPDLGFGDLRVADFNVLNYFVTLKDSGEKCGPASLNCRGADNQAEFNKQAAKIVAALDEMNADIIGLHELENPKAGVPFSDWAVSDLTRRLNNKSGRTSCAGGRYRAVNPGKPLGEDAIQNALIYCDKRVRLDEVDVLDDSKLSGLGISGLAPVFDGPNTNRVVLGAKLTDIANNRDLTVVVTHQKSKGARKSFRDSCASSGNADPNCDQNDGAGFWNKRRDDASTAIRRWLASNNDLRSELQLIIGDINAYGQEDPVRNFTTNGYADLKTERSGADSYVYKGRWGSLDRAMANGALNARVTGANAWAINAEEPRAFDYNENFKGEGSAAKSAALAAYYSPDKFRSSDHSPMLVGICMKENTDECGAPAPVMGGFGVAGLGLGLMGLAGLGLRRRK